MMFCGFPIEDLPNKGDEMNSIVIWLSARHGVADAAPTDVEQSEIAAKRCVANHPMTADGVKC
jgi:hypothetical protein